jgi:hypothetical protein
MQEPVQCRSVSESEFGRTKGGQISNATAVVLAVFAVAVSVTAFVYGYPGRYQIASTADNLVFRLDTVTGQMTAHRVHSQEEATTRRFIQEIASMPK